MAGEDLPTIAILVALYATCLASIALCIIGIVKQNYRALVWAGVAFLPTAIVTTGYPGLRYFGFISVLSIIGAVLMLAKGKVRLSQFMTLPLLIYASGVMVLALVSR